MARFGGLTAQQRDLPVRGIWHGETRLYLDQVIVLTVLDFRRQGAANSSLNSNMPSCCTRRFNRDST